MTGSLAALVTVTVGAVMSATNREQVGRLARTVSGVDNESIPEKPRKHGGFLALAG